MSAPKFSVVVPTRERADTLRHTLDACLRIDHPSYEIVVCDNFSSPETRAVVESFASPRIVYHRSPKPLTMGDNWNLAYTLTRGDYITFIGDDDSMLPTAFRTLDDVFAQERVAAVRWDCALYSWPTIARPDLADYLQVSFRSGARRMNGRAAIRDVMASRISAVMLPNIYHGCASRDVLESIRARSGHVFGSYNCDTYSSFAIASSIEDYVTLAQPLSIMGFSSHSHNIAFNFMRGKHETTQSAHLENSSGGLAVHPMVPNIAEGFVPVADSFLTAKAELFPDDDSLVLDRPAMIEHFLNHPPIDAPEEWPDLLAELRRTLSDDPALLSWFEETSRAKTPTIVPPHNFKFPVEGVFDDIAHLAPSRYGATDVAEATLLAAECLLAAQFARAFRSPAVVRRVARFIRDSRVKLMLRRRRDRAHANGDNRPAR